MKFHWGMIAKYDIDPDDFYIAATLADTQIAALPGDVNGKNRTESEKKLNSNLYLCSRNEAQRISKVTQLRVDIKTVRYPRVLDYMELVFKREWHVTHERDFVLWTQTTRT